MSRMNVLFYFTAIVFFCIGGLYIVAAVLVHVNQAVSLQSVDYLAISMWVLLSFFLGTILIWYACRRAKLRKEQPEIVSSPILKESKQNQLVEITTEKTAVGLTVAPQPSKSTSKNHEPVGSTSQESDELKLLYTLGELSDEEYEQRKKIKNK